MDSTDRKIAGIAALAVIAVVAIWLFSTRDAEAADVYYEDGTVVHVPEASWEVVIRPLNFNLQPFHYPDNLLGKEGEVWPLYEAFCPIPDFSPSPTACERPTVDGTTRDDRSLCDGFSPRAPGCKD
jgi:hypothetical protein